MRNKVTGIVLLLCLFIPSIGTYSWLQYQKKLLRKEVHKKINSGINREQLVLLKFTLSEARTILLWEHSKEFEYNGQMYDVADTKSTVDSIFYWCWWDREETELNSQLKSLVTRAFENNLQKKESQKQLVDFYQSLYYSQTIIWHIILYQTVKETYPYSFDWQSLSWPPPVPPPELR